MSDGLNKLLEDVLEYKTVYLKFKKGKHYDWCFRAALKYASKNWVSVKFWCNEKEFYINIDEIWSSVLKGGCNAIPEQTKS